MNGTIEYYLFARRLQWNRAQALLREHILAALNVLLGRFGLGRLDVRGLPSASELSLSIERLQRGESPSRRPWRALGSEISPTASARVVKT